MSDINVINLNNDDDHEEEFAEFLDGLKTGNESAVFLVTKKDGSLHIGSTARSAKDLLWDLYHLKKFMASLVENGEEED